MLLVAAPLQMECKIGVENTHSKLYVFRNSFPNYCVIVVCSLSLALCYHAIWRAKQLNNSTNTFFLRRYQKMCGT